MNKKESQSPWKTIFIEGWKVVVFILTTGDGSGRPQTPLDRVSLLL